MAAVWALPRSSAPGGSSVNCALEQAPAHPARGAALSLGGARGVWEASALVTPGSGPLGYCSPVPSPQPGPEQSSVEPPSPLPPARLPRRSPLGARPGATFPAPQQRPQERPAPSPGNQQDRAGGLLLDPVAKLGDSRGSAHVSDRRPPQQAELWARPPARQARGSRESWADGTRTCRPVTAPRPCSHLGESQRRQPCGWD